jgi:nucleotide-binding universal stress UspA family protein
MSPRTWKLYGRDDRGRFAYTMNRLQLRNVLCPVELSSPAMNPLEWAAAIARARSAALTAFHVVVTEGLVPKSLTPAERGDLIKKLHRTLLASDSQHAHTAAVIEQGDPGTQILEFARPLPADIVVMGAAGAQRPARPMGSVTAAVVARCDCPVLIVPTGQRIDRVASGVFKQILCAIGLAPSSAGVIRQALSLAWETHGRVTCVCVMTEPSPSPAEIRAQLLAAIPSEAYSWCDIDVVIKQGVPATEIVRVAEMSNVDILLIGPPRQWSSTTQAVLAKSLCPVLVTHDARPLPDPLGEVAGTSS